VPKIINFGQSILKIPAKNDVGLINLGQPCMSEKVVRMQKKVIKTRTKYNDLTLTLDYSNKK